MVAVMEGPNNAQTLCGKPHKSQPGKGSGQARMFVPWKR